VEKLIRFVADALVDHGDQVRVEKQEENGDLSYTLLLHPEDLGRMIGRHGKTAEALRVLLSTAGQREGRRVFLRIREQG
jgi:predicted RNA-binding protein YlqC (UPF0109 family)